MDSPNDWEYLAEGGANIVFRYIGLNSKYKTKVLRVRKNNCLFIHDLIKFLPEYHGFIYHHLNISESNNQIRLIKASPYFLEALNFNSFSQRPDHRRSKAKIDASLTEVLLLPDLLTEKFSCEIKPKWSGRNHVHSKNEICNCRFCLAQILKGRRAESNRTLSYCPRLLFSKNYADISNSVYDLFNNPSNQLRLYVDSIMVSPENLSHFIDKVQPIISDIICKEPFFQKFVEFQFQLLDGINFDTTEYHDIDLTTYKLDLEKLLRVENVPFHEIPSYLRIIIAMSIRDSSFIISFRPHSLASNWKTILSGTLLYDYKIDLIDLDLKPIEKLEKYINEIKLHG